MTTIIGKKIGGATAARAARSPIGSGPANDNGIPTMAAGEEKIIATTKPNTTAADRAV